jgi:hypothetical protein
MNKSIGFKVSRSCYCKNNGLNIQVYFGPSSKASLNRDAFSIQFSNVTMSSVNC